MASLTAHAMAIADDLENMLLETERLLRELIVVNTMTLLLDQGATANPASIIVPHAGVAAAPDDPALAKAVAEALKAVDVLSDDHHLNCPICLVEDDDSTAWKETPCGHRFHGRCVERWLLVKGSCPMCRRQVVTMPTAGATRTVTSYLDSVLRFLSRNHGQDTIDVMEADDVEVHGHDAIEDMEIDGAA